MPAQSNAASIGLIDVDNQHETTMVLRGILAVQCATQFAAAIREAAKRALPVRLDCVGVEHLDTSALQLLTALQQAGERGGWSVTIDSLSPALKAQVELAGLTSWLRLPADIVTS